MCGCGSYFTLFSLPESKRFISCVREFCDNVFHILQQPFYCPQIQLTLKGHLWFTEHFAVFFPVIRGGRKEILNYKSFLISFSFRDFLFIRFDLFGFFGSFRVGKLFGLFVRHARQRIKSFHIHIEGTSRKS